MNRKGRVISGLILIVAFFACAFYLFAFSAYSKVDLFNSVDNSGAQVVEQDRSNSNKYGYVEMGYDNQAVDLDVDDIDEMSDINTATEKEIIETSESDIPSSYNSVSNLIANYPYTRNQNPYGTCWAHAATGAAEFSIVSKGLDKFPSLSSYTNTSLDLSEMQLIYYTWHGAEDPLGGTAGDYKNLSGSCLESGYNAWGAIRSLVQGTSYTDETIVKYEDASSIESSGLTSDYARDYNKVNLKNAYIINIESDTDKVKAAIEKCGSVSMSFAYYTNSNYISSDKKSYYSTETGTNHEVLIVGWDDNYDASKFKTTPAGNGAWLCRNSWSSSSYTSNESIYKYFWLSYYDTSINNAVYAYDYDDVSDYDNYYIYDGASWTSSTSCKTTANVFNVHGTQGATSEDLTAVSFEIRGASAVGYQVDVYTDLTDRTNPESGTLHENVASGTTSFAGTYTIDLDEHISLDSGRNFSVVVKLASDAKSGLDVEYSYSDSKAVVNEGESYYKSGSNWYMPTRLGSWCGDFCIRALTCDGDSYKDTYNIHFDGNQSESGVMDDISDCQANKEYTLSSNTYTRTGYTFTGWNTKSDGSGTSYADKAVVSNLSEHSTVTLYAQWEPITYTVKFDVGLGTGSIDSIEAIYDQPVTLPECTATCEGYYFEGWNTASDFSGTTYAAGNQLYNLTSVSGGQVTLYALWLEDVDFVVDSNGQLTNYRGSGGDIVIPNTVKSIKAPTSTSNDDGPFANSLTTITSISFEEGSQITQIPRYCFANMTALTSIELPDSVTAISNYAFFNCIKLASLDLSDNVTDLGYSFIAGTGISSITIPKTVTSTSGIFYGTTKLTTVTLEDGTTAVRHNQFSGAGYLTTVNIPDSVTSIGNNAFNGCSSIKTIVIPYKVTSIGSNAFNGCSQLRSLTIYDGVLESNIDSSAIINTASTNLTVYGIEGSGIQSYCTNNGLTFQALSEDEYPSYYSIIFNGNGNDSGSMADMTLIGMSETVKLTTNAYSRDNYIFKGWNTKADGTGTSYADGANVSALTTVSRTNVTLYAQWDPIKYNIEFKANGGTGTMSNMSNLNYDQTYSLTANSFTRTGYSFNGWSTCDDGSGTIYRDGQSVSNLTTTAGDTIVLYAQWSPITYSIAFDANGGSGTMSNLTSLTYNYGYNLSSNQFTREGYSFSKWNTSSDGQGNAYSDGQYVRNLSSTSGAVVTLYAQWTPNQYVVTYDVNGGNDLSNSQAWVSYGQAYGTMPEPTRAGYTFDGWYTLESGGSEITSTSIVSTTSDQTLYAHWTANKYTVYFDVNGGDALSTTSKQVTFEQIYGDLPTPTRTGYKFLGWYTDASDGEIVTSENTVTITSSQTLYAQWSANTYRVSFDVNDGDALSTTSKQVTFEQIYGDLPEPSRTGYTFDGWYTLESGGSKITSTSIVAITANQTLYAHWTVNNYRVSFDVNGGETLSVTSMEVTYGQTYGTLPATSRTDYIFLGWYTEASSGQQITTDTVFETAEDQTLYAHWQKIIKYSIIFDSNNGTGSMDNMTNLAYGQSYNLSANKFTRQGYNFAGWNRRPDGSGTSFSDGQSVLNLTTADNASVRLYAQWTPKEYTVTFNANGGYVASETMTVTYSKKYNQLPTPSRTDYVFVGWYTDASAGDLVTADSVYVLTDNQTLYAHWHDIIEYNISFDSNNGDGSMTDMTDMLYGQTYTLTSNAFNRTGYTFAGWNTKSDGSGVAYNDSQLVSNLTATDGEKVTLYAQWTANKYNLNFNVNGGNKIATTTKQVTYDEAFGKLPSPSRKGYTFVGWYNKAGTARYTECTAKLNL